jgi:hypothetical protein
MRILLFSYMWEYMHAITCLMSASSTWQLYCLCLALYVHVSLSVPWIWQNLLSSQWLQSTQNLTGVLVAVCAIYAEGVHMLDT